MLERGTKSPARRRGTPTKSPAISIHRTSCIGILDPVPEASETICDCSVPQNEYLNRLSGLPQFMTGHLMDCFDILIRFRHISNGMMQTDCMCT
jgi:hypothetical protein